MRQKGFAPILIIVLVLIGIAGIYYFGNRKGNILPTPTPTEKITNKSSELVSVDDSWNLYTNHNLKFSMKIPKNIYHSYGSCEWINSANPSYRPLGAIVPVATFELKDRVFISTSYFYELSGETDKNGVGYFSKCNKIENSIAKLQDRNAFQQQKWEVIAAQIATEADLEKFVKDNYGPGCKIEEKKASSQDGVFDISIKSLGIGAGQASLSCGINYTYYLKYSPQRSWVVTWIFGQAYNFQKNAKNDAYDNEMVKSFNFVD